MVLDCLFVRECGAGRRFIRLQIMALRLSCCDRCVRRRDTRPLLVSVLTLRMAHHLLGDRQVATRWIFLWNAIFQCSHFFVCWRAMAQAHACAAIECCTSQGSLYLTTFKHFGITHHCGVKKCNAELTKLAQHKLSTATKAHLRQRHTCCIGPCMTRRTPLVSPGAMTECETST